MLMKDNMAIKEFGIANIQVIQVKDNTAMKAMVVYKRERERKLEKSLHHSFGFCLSALLLLANSLKDKRHKDMWLGICSALLSITKTSRDNSDSEQ